MNLREPSTSTAGFVERIQAMPDPRAAIGRDYVRGPYAPRRSNKPYGTRQERAARDAEIVRLRAKKMLLKEIAWRFDLTEAAISLICIREGIR